MASLFHYFKRDSAVPSPHGALSSSVPTSAIDSANKLVKPLVDKCESHQAKEVRGAYDVFTPEEKAKIAKCATEIAIRKLSKQFPIRSLKESTVRTWMNKYKKE